jgi:hypothetical protein
MEEACSTLPDIDRPPGDRGDGEKGELLIEAGDCRSVELFEGDLDKERRISPIAECGSI